MLNKWQCIWQEASVRRLAIALIFSLLLHAVLVGKFTMHFPDVSDQHEAIEARLVLPKASANKSSVNKLNTSATKPPKKVQPAAVAPPDLAPVPPPESLTNSINNVVPVAPAVINEVESIAPVIPPVTEPVLVAQEAEAGVIVNHNPYKYVESEFDVYTDKAATLNSSAAGKAKMVYQLLPNAEQYHIKSLVEAKGFAALIYPDLLQTSDGYVGTFGLSPTHYLYQLGDKKNKTFSADFDWNAKKIKLQGERGQQTLDLAEGAQDLLSFMYQFMFIAPLQNMQLNITNGKKISMNTYSFEGEEIIHTKMGDLKTVHLLKVASDGEKTTELWLASEYQYVPVKIRETGKNEKVYELLIKSLKTEKPEPAPQ